MALPSLISVPRVYGANQSGNTRWSPFGPNEQNLIISVIGDFQGMFNAFTAGSIDLTDWPVFPANLPSGCGTPGPTNPACFCAQTSNPDFFCTTPTNELGIFDEQINSANSFMGKPLTVSRATVIASATAGASTTACSTGFGSLTVTLENQETGNSIIKDAFNGVTAANQPSGVPSSTVGDSGGTNSTFPGGPVAHGNNQPNGIYNVPCLLAGSYLLSTTIYGGSATTTIASNTNTAVTLKVNWNSLSGVSDNANRYYFGAAVAHLLEGPAFVSAFFGSAATHDNTFDPGDALVTAPNGTQLTAADCFLNGVATNPDLHPWATQCASFPSGGFDTSAYLLTPASVAGGTLWWQVGGTGPFAPGTGYSGLNDLRAACDDFAQMGFAVQFQNGTASNCLNVATALSSGATAPPAALGTTSNYPHLVPTGTVNIWNRKSQGRGQFGTIISDTLNAMFGTPSSTGGGTVCYGLCPNPTPIYYTFGQVAPFIFNDGPISAGGSGPNNWNLYTGGFSLTSTPDFLYALFNTLFSGGTVCSTPTGNPANSPSPGNYPFFCSPKFDTDSAAGEFGTSTTYGPLFSRAAIDMMNHVADVPVWSGVDTFVEQNGWNYQQCTGFRCANTQSSLVNTIGSGTEVPFWSLLNARQVPNYNVTSSKYTPGAGDPNTLRFGFSQTTAQLSLFQFTSVWEAAVIGEVYDSMLAINPLTFASSGQLLDWQTTSHRATFSPTQTCISPGTGLVTGCTTQTWNLRNDLKFQDGNKVTASDIAYSILSYRDVPSSNLQSAVANVASAVGVNCGVGQPCNQLQVVLALQSPFYEVDIGGLPILEQALWQPTCGSVSTINASPFENGIPSGSSSLCANLSFDPMTATNPLTGKPGIFIGDGPYACVNPATVTTGPNPNPNNVGGICTENSDGSLGTQAVGLSGRILLERSTPGAAWTYFRCCPGGTASTSNSLYMMSYAEGNALRSDATLDGNGQANPLRTNGVVNFLDLSNLGACWKVAPGTTGPLCSTAASSHWVNDNPGHTAPGVSGFCNGGASNCVDLSDLSFLAFYYGAGTVSNGGNSVLSSMTGIDPQYDPFNCPISGC